MRGYWDRRFSYLTNSLLTW